MPKNLKSRSLIQRRFNRKAKQKGSKSRTSKASHFSFESLEPRQLLAVTTFQDGFSDYEGTEDTILYSQRPNTNFGGETSMSPDQQDADGVRQGLLQFTDIFGPEQDGQVPLGSTINSATLAVSVVNSSTAQMQMSLYRMRESWTQGTATWNSFGEIGGVQASEGESTDLPPDATLFDPNTGVMTFDVTRSLKNWAAGQANYGWLIESAATDGWDFDTSEAAQVDRPKLTVDYTAPSGAGQIQFIEDTLRIPEGDSSNSVPIAVSRLGGVDGAIDATYTVTAVTAVGDVIEESGTVDFADGVTSATINVTINGDASLEGNETFTVTLAGANADSNNDTLTATIADDDALINEVLANVSAGTVGQPLFDETNLEFVELIGTPGASLDGYYFVVFEGQEEETADTTDETGSGVADVVVDLTGQTFGANGLLLIRPENFGQAVIGGELTQLPGFAVSADTNELEVSGFTLEDNSQTYALIRSTVAIVQGTDYDTVGEYVDDTQESIDSPLGEVGVLDVAPFTTGEAQIVDSVFVQQGSSDRDRAAVTSDLGLPGVHVHQPTRTEGSERQTSDAVSRREGNKLPNTIGAWFNGDIEDDEADDDPIAYLNGTTRISVVAPLGSVLTPGDTNTLRNVFVTADAESFDESSGEATFTVTRTGDTSEEITVDFTTVDGTATAGADYTPQSGTLTFVADGVATEQSQQVTITLSDDGVAEGFETLSLQVTGADAPFLITQDLATVTINDANVSVATFQEGVVGSQGGVAYTGNSGAYIDASQPNFFFGFSDRVVVDDAAGDPEFGGAAGADIRPQQGLIKFDNLFGAGDNQVPLGAQIFGGFLTVNVLSESADSANIKFFRMLQDWDDLATWTDPRGGAGGGILNGVTPDGEEAAAFADSAVTLPAVAGEVQVPLSAETLQAWSTGALDNFGWMIVSDSGSSWEISSEGALFPELRPELTILYTDPVGAGEFTFAETALDVSEGAPATVTVQRVGGAAGAASVGYEVTPGSASPDDLSGSTSGLLNFADGELRKTFQILTANDTTSEIDETVNITLTGGGVLAGGGEATLTIRNNDVSEFNPPVLMSEVVYNQPGNDGGGELIELVGDPGAPLGGLYAVVIAGDIGVDQGATDLVVDLGGFTNGSNGHTLIGGRDSFTWNVPTGTTFIGLEELNVEFLGGNDNGTSTYALVYSPLTPLHEGRFDYDFNNNGSLELPAGAVIVDSIGIRDNSATDSTYGGGANTLQTNPVASFDAVSRLPGTTGRNNAGNWYGADIQGGDDALVYDDNFSTNLPSVGAAATPGELNTGDDAANPLASVDSVDATSAVTVSFTGTVSQVLIGDATSFTGLIGPGISVTNTDGSEIAGVDAIPQVSGLGSDTLTLSFSGSETVDGQLPEGTYNLNFVGNSVVASGRGLDAANTGAGPSNTSIQFDAPRPLIVDADFNNDGLVGGFDFLALQRGFGVSSGATNADGDANGDESVDEVDSTLLAQRFGSIVPAGVAEASLSSASNAWVESPDSQEWTAGRRKSELRREAQVDVVDLALRGGYELKRRLRSEFSVDDVASFRSQPSEASERSAVDEAFADLGGTKFRPIV